MCIYEICVLSGVGRVKGQSYHYNTGLIFPLKIQKLDLLVSYKLSQSMGLTHINQPMKTA